MYKIKHEQVNVNLFLDTYSNCKNEMMMNHCEMEQESLVNARYICPGKPLGKYILPSKELLKHEY